MTQHQPRAKAQVDQVVEKYIQYRGPNRYRVQIREEGIKVNKTFKTLEEAKAFRDVTVGALTGRTYVDTRLGEKTLLKHACEWGLSVNPKTGRPNMDKGDANWKNHRARLRWWRDKSMFRLWPLAGQNGIHDYDLKRWVDEVTSSGAGDDLEDADAAAIELGRLEGLDVPVRAVSNQTIAHRLNTLSVLYREWRRTHSLTEEQCPNPVLPYVRPPLKDKGRKARRLEDGEFEKLIEAAEASSRPWLSEAITIAVETAMRQTELASVTWDRTFLSVEHPYCHLPKTKNGEERTVPLSDVAVAAFLRLRAKAEEHNAKRKARIEAARTEKQLAAALACEPWEKPLPVETGRGIIHAFRDAVFDARERARLAGDENWAALHNDRRWHDLRHEAVSRIFELTNMRESEVMDIVGHLGKEMLRHYLKLRTPLLGAKLPGRGTKEDKAGTVKVFAGAPTMVRDMDGRWIPLAAADSLVRDYARKGLLEALAELDRIAAE